MGKWQSVVDYHVKKLINTFRYYLQCVDHRVSKLLIILVMQLMVEVAESFYYCS